MVPRAGIEPARPFSGKRRILSPQCLPISPSGRRLPNAHLRHSVTRAARTRNAPVLSGERNARSTGLSPSPRKKGSRSFPCIFGAGKESRTLDLNLGKVALYQLSYSRILLTLLINYQSESVSLKLYRYFLLRTIANQKNLPTLFSFYDFIRPHPEAVKTCCDCNRNWRRGPESNRTNRICNPGHNRFATAPETTALAKKGS